LQTIALRAKVLVRRSDFFARIGGEEFCILLSNTNAEGAGVFSQRLIEDIASQPCRVTEEVQVAMTVSIGQVTINDHDREFASLLKRSDDALYSAKAKGRNRVVIG
jgi:diguanylate cyclase (GGDEF)-like protein